LLERIADRIAAERFVITRTWQQIPLMTRWTLFGHSGKSGSGTDRAVYLHRFHRSDADEMHDHPWPFVSIILAGGYHEVTPAKGWTDGVGPVLRRWYGPGRVLVRPASWIHRVEIPEGRDAWTLIVRGTKERSWGFWCPSGGFIPWRRHLANAEATGEGCPA
jgi:hypothetical protein